MRSKIWLTALLVGVLALPALSLMTTEVITGTYSPEYQGDTQNKALGELGNSPGRVYATTVFFSEIGVTESLYFTGDAKAFNAFLAKYALLNERFIYPSLTLAFMKEDAELHPVLRIEKQGSGCDGKPIEYQEIRYDWVLTHYLPGSKGTVETVYLELWPGKVEWDKVRFSANLSIKNYPETKKP